MSLSVVGPPLGSGQAADANDEEILYMGALMDDIQDTWDRKFEEAGRQYQFTTLVAFEGSVATGCGNATSAVGPRSPRSTTIARHAATV